MEKMKKNLILIGDSFLNKKNSAAVLLQDLYEELKKDHNITVLYVSSNKEGEDLENFFCIQPLLKIEGKLPRLINECTLSFFALYKLKTNNQLNDYDIILWYSPTIFWGPLIYFLKKINTSAQCLLVLRDIFPEWAIEIGILKSKIAIYFLQTFAKLQYKIADEIFVQSEGNKNYFYHNPTLIGKVKVLENWLSTKTNYLEPLDLDKTKISRRKIIIYSGNLGEAQGKQVAEKLILLITKSKAFGLLFIGTGLYMKELKLLYQNLPGVLFLEPCSPEEIRGLYKQSVFGLTLLDAKHKSHNIPGKFISYLRDNLPVLFSINANNDMRDIVLSNNLGLEIDLENKGIEEFEKELDNFLEKNSNSPLRVEYFQRNYSVEVAASVIRKSFRQFQFKMKKNEIL